MTITSIRPSSDLRNHYAEISKLCHETRRPVAITVNGREDSVLMGFQEYQQMQAELELLRTLSEARADLEAGRLRPAAEVHGEIDAMLRQEYGV